MIKFGKINIYLYKLFKYIYVFKKYNGSSNNSQIYIRLMALKFVKL